MKPLDQMTDEELADLHSKEVGLDKMSDADLAALHKTATAPEPIGPLETAAKEALDTATMGYGPNVIAGTKKLVGATDDYTKERDAQRAQLIAGKEANPKAAMAGTGAGIVGSIGAMALAPEIELPAAAAKVAQAFPAVSKVAKIFAGAEGMSALKNPGDVEGEISGPQITERTDNALKDAPLNALFAVTGGVVSNKLDKLAQNKNLEAFKAIGPMKPDIKDAESRFRTADLADFIKKNGIIDGFPDEKSILERANVAKERAGKVIGDLFKRNTPEVAKKVPNALDTYDPDALVKIISTNREGESEAAKAVGSKVQNIIDDIKSNKGSDDLDLNDLHRVKQRVQDQIRNWKTAMAVDKNAGPMVDMFKSASGYFDDMMADKLNQVGGNLGAEMRVANRNFNLASNVNQIASDAYYSSENASKGSNLIGDLINNIAAPMRGKLPPAVATPNLNAKIANMGPMAMDTSQAVAQGGLPAAYQSMQTPPMLSPQQQEMRIKNTPGMSNIEKAKRINQQRKGIKSAMTQ